MITYEDITKKAFTYAIDRHNGKIKHPPLSEVSPAFDAVKYVENDVRENITDIIYTSPDLLDATLGFLFVDTSADLEVTTLSNLAALAVFNRMVVDVDCLLLNLEGE